jgi:hypothetical protein
VERWNKMGVGHRVNPHPRVIGSTSTEAASPAGECGARRLRCLLRVAEIVRLRLPKATV